MQTQFLRTYKRVAQWSMVGLAILSLLAACQSTATIATPIAPHTGETVVYCAWPSYMPQAVLDAFAAESGIKVDYQPYHSQEEGIAQMKAGKTCDVVVIDNELIPSLLADGMLAEIDYHHVANFKNISANFRDLAYDPGNKHSIPFNWGTTGLLYRQDLITKPVTRWADLWDAHYAGKVAIWAIPQSLLPIALKRLGYSANSEKPEELAQALKSLLELKKNVIFLDLNEASSTPTLIKGQAILAYGWAYDALTSQKQTKNIAYVLPQEGSILWGDNLVIMAKSQHKTAAEAFLNFVLRPEIGAQIVNDLFYANANEAARSFVNPELLKNPLIFPAAEALKNAEIILPASPTGKQLRDEIWAKFMAALPQPKQ